jgi:hypothetical protein
LKAVELAIEKARCREINADIKIKQKKAAKLQAEAEEAAHRARKEPARQDQALFAGWVRIVSTVVVLFIFFALLAIGLLVTPLTYPPAILVSSLLYLLRPWEFVFAHSDEAQKDPP